METAFSGRELGWVYFAGAPAVNRVKVGYSEKTPLKRFSGLQTSAPVDLKFLGIMRGGRQEESLIHRYLHRSHWKNEWFDASPLLFDFIRENARLDPSHDEFGNRWRVSLPEYIRVQGALADRVIDWFDSRGTDFSSGSLRSGNRKSEAATPVRQEFARVKTAMEEYPTDFEEAVRPMNLIREALRTIEPEWRLPFLRCVRGEKSVPGLFFHLAAHPARLAAVETVFNEMSDRMRHFSVVMEDVAEGLPYSIPA